MIQNRVNVCLILLLLSATRLSFALPDDKKQILTLTADTADINQETRQGIFVHHVELDQGSTHLRAEHATAEVNLKNQLIKAIAKGDLKEQAHFWTLTDANKPPLHAYANTISYFPDQHLIVLTGKARVEQGTDSFVAPSITYDTLHQPVISKADNTGQTIIMIHPEKHS